MNLNKIIACGMLLGLLSSVSLAQRARLNNGGTLPGARLPNAVSMGGGTVHAPNQGAITPKISTTPNAAHAKTVGPNAASKPDAGTVNPNATTSPDARTANPNTVGSPDAAR